MDENISIIIPTYNERDNIAPLVEKLQSILTGYHYEIVFVDDNSQDGTAELALSLSARYPVRVIVRRNEKGLASAVVHGFAHTTSQIIGVMDADLQHPPETIPALVKALADGADIAIASRYIRGGGSPGWGLARRILSRGAILLAHLLLPSTRSVRDPMSGFFMFKRSVLAGTDLKPTGYKILLEMLVLGRFHKIAEVPYSFANRRGGRSKLGTAQQVDYLKHIFDLMKRKGELARFGKFLAVGGSGVGVNLGAYWLLTRLLHLNRFSALAISFEISVVSNFLLNNFITFSDRRVSKPLSFFSQLLKFNLISIAGLGIQEGSLWLFHSELKINDVISVLIGIILATLWNYLVNTWWTWK